MPHTGCAPGAFQAGKLAGRTVYDFLGLENSGFHFSLSHLLIFIPSASPPRLLPTIDAVGSVTSDICDDVKDFLSRIALE